MSVKAADFETSDTATGIKRQFPTIIALTGAVLVMIWRSQTPNFMSDEAFMMVALACYLMAALFELTNIYAPSRMSSRISLWTATLGVFFNLSSWLVRWISAYERELGMLRDAGNPETPWIFRYIPFANLYDLSLAFAFGAGLTTLLLINRKQFRFIGAFTLPLAAIILTLARFIGSEFIDLPPVLDSYWRPIHVGVASLSYGVTLVCFAVAVIYLLKDKVKPEAMAVWASVFSLGVVGTISKYSVLTGLVYRAGIFVPSSDGSRAISTPFRLAIPFVGELLALSAVLLAAVIIAYLLYLYQDNMAAKRLGKFALIGALVLQVAAVGFWVNGVNSATDVYPRLEKQIAGDRSQMTAAGRDIVARQNLSAQEFAAISPEQFEQTADRFLKSTGSGMFLSLKTNPVEFAGLITAIAGLGFVLLFGYKTEVLIERMPPLDTLDGLMYKTACLAFAGLAMLLITGAIWANESWGRPWGFDSKETGALVAWLTYAAFLHTRITRGWKGRSSAYFAILGFLLVIFTYLGVSYLLPGLHSYA
ncbi:MAG: cytochrome c biogenesis protein CcsA [Acidobacteriota bacterium]|nr:cytochrome c biogenesis protein CcsA [Acidobacteriota bacterium]